MCGREDGRGLGMYRSLDNSVEKLVEFGVWNEQKLWKMVLCGCKLKRSQEDGQSVLYSNATLPNSDRQIRVTAFTTRSATKALLVDSYEEYSCQLWCVCCLPAHNLSDGASYRRFEITHHLCWVPRGQTVLFSLALTTYQAHHSSVSTGSLLIRNSRLLGSQRANKNETQWQAYL